MVRLRFLRARANRREIAAGTEMSWLRGALTGAVTVLVALALGCAGEVLVGTQDPGNDDDDVPPPPPAGVASGVISVTVTGLGAGATSGGSVTATPTGDTPGDPATVNVPTAGTVEWTTAAGAYGVRYTAPPGYSLEPGQAADVDVDIAEDQTTELEYAVRSVDSPPPPPPPSADCTIVVMEGESPQDAVEGAGPGDVICLNGTFDLDQSFDGGTVINRNGRMIIRASQSGTPENPIVLRNEPGFEARIVGDFNEPTNLYVYIDGSHWQVVGLTIETGGILVGVVENVQIIANTIRRPVFPNGNAGAIRTLGGTSAGGRNILIEDNLIEDIYGCFTSPAPLEACSPNSAVPWDQVGDRLHIAAVKKQGVDTSGDGLHIIRGNIIRRVPSPQNTKHESDDLVFVEDNIFEDAQWNGRCNTVPVVTEGNEYINIGLPDANACPRG